MEKTVGGESISARFRKHLHVHGEDFETPEQRRARKKHLHVHGEDTKF